MNDKMSKEQILELIKKIKKTTKNMENRPPEEYRRGDAELMMNNYMFISIMEEGLKKEEDLERKLTKEEGHQILRDHGWTVK